MTASATVFYLKSGNAILKIAKTKKILYFLQNIERCVKLHSLDRRSTCSRHDVRAASGHGWRHCTDINDTEQTLYSRSCVGPTFRFSPSSFFHCFLLRSELHGISLILSCKRIYNVENKTVRHMPWWVAFQSLKSGSKDGPFELSERHWCYKCWLTSKEKSVECPSFWSYELNKRVLVKIADPNGLRLR